jgi:predicted regulator of Ras-like GTPase activity (Roadblock/LC7/MglB family)
MKTVNDFLRELYNKKGVEVVLLIGSNGMIISSLLPKSLKFSRIGEIEWIKGTAPSIATQLEQNKLNAVNFDLKTSRIFFTKVGKSALLVTIGKPTSDISVITLHSNVTATVIETLLQNRRVTDKFVESKRKEAIEKLKGVVMDAFITEQYGIDMEEFG